jgi:hypothetical protein
MSASNVLSSNSSLEKNMAEQPRFPQGLRAALALTVLSAAAVEAWAFRHFVTIDGISYLDAADAWFSGDFKDAISGHWSPMYSWLLGAFLKVLHVSPDTEFGAVHLFNLLLFGVALISFGHLLESLFAYVQQSRDDSLVRPLPPTIFIVLAYIAFAWAGIVLIGVRNTTPDLLVLIGTLWATDILLQIRAKGASWMRYSLLGFVLVLSYLSKAIMFPLGFVFVAASIFAARNSRQGLRLAALAMAVFLLLSGPFILALSRKQGHLTFSESGKLNYGWFVNDAQPAFVHWQGQPPGMGSPLHPTRQILPDLPVFEFAAPIYGTYPAWYDPTYWWAGMRTHFSLREQLRAIFRNGRKVINVFFDLDGVWIFSLTVLICAAGTKNYIRQIQSNAFLFLPPVAGILLYLVVLTVERYLAPFALVILVVMLASVWLPANDPLSKRVATSVLVAAVLVTAFSGLHFLTWSKSVIAEAEAVPYEMWKAADGARQLGIRPGDKIAELEPAIREDRLLARSENPVLARLLGVRITAELAPPDNNFFWSSDEVTQQRILHALASTGAKAVIDYDIPPVIHPEGWIKLDGTRFYLRRLDHD